MPKHSYSLHVNIKLNFVNYTCAGKLVSVHVKKQDGLPGFLTLYLEYFDTVRSIKEGINLDKNMRVAQSQQQLFLEENLLEDSLTLSECGIEDGCQILVKGMRYIIITFQITNPT